MVKNGLVNRKNNSLTLGNYELVVSHSPNTNTNSYIKLKVDKNRSVNNSNSKKINESANKNVFMHNIYQKQEGMKVEFDLSSSIIKMRFKVKEIEVFKILEQ